jgi:FkbM family methyltransferase
MRRTLAALLPPALAGRLRVLRARRRAERFADRVVRHRYGGRELSVEIGSEYGLRYDADWEQLPEIAALREHALRPGARVFDLGANHGVVAMMLADAVGPGGEVIALEADAADAERCRRNAAANGLVQIRTLHAAVARERGTIAFSVEGQVDHSGGRHGRMEVEAWSLDALAERFGAPDVVFIDVEGYEGEALRGAEGLLARPGVDWFVEVHGDEMLGRYGSSVDEIVERFRAAGSEIAWAPDLLQRRPDGTVFSPAVFVGAGEAPRPDGRFFLIARV